MNRLSLLKQSKLLFNKKNANPIYLTFFVTNKCNARCPYCFYWKELGKTKDELKLKEIEKITKTMSPFPNLLLSGGEPFLREDIVKIVNLFYKNNKISHLTIPTNGIDTARTIGLTKRILNTCSDLNFLISITLDGFENEHEKIKGKGSFKKAINTYHQLIDMKKTYPLLNVGISLTISPLNQNYILEFYEYIKNELKPDLISPLLIRGEPKSKELKKVDIRFYEKLNKKIEEDLISKNIKGYDKFLFSKLAMGSRLIRNKLIAKTFKENKYLIPCYAGLLNAVLYSDGGVYPCELLNRKIGNLRDYNYDFKKLWDSNEARDIRKDIKKSKCFCTHECNMTTNILFNVKYLPKLIYGLK
ncbi:MAG: radical SAM protein [Nanoarchaeota archaeon]|nr:radical SAM protein [Nanoarchaeota archaeon]